MAGFAAPEITGGATVFSAFLNNVWKTLVRCMSYTVRVRKHVKNLKQAKETLRASLKDVNNEIQREERRQKEPKNEVEDWKTRVDKLTAKVDAIERAYEQRCCSFNCFSNCWIGMRAAHKLREVEALQKAQPPEVTAEVVPPSAQEIAATPVVQDIPTTTSASNFDEALHYLKDDKETTPLGIWGMGGVGKTTLLEKINNHLADQESSSGFNRVIFVVASTGCTVEKLQKDIIKKLGLQEGRDASSTIFNFLKTKNFLLLLDDVWDRLDLKAVGIPLPLGVVNQCKRKVILATRSKEVCGNMEAHRRLKVECLRPEAAWSLFQEKAGERVIRSHPAIPQLAMEVAAECGGLPLALITIGRAMSSKETPREWEHALRLLRNSRLPEIPGTHKNKNDDELFPLLKFSYDYLDSDRTKECFLCCALWPEDCEIEEAELIECWMGLDLIDGYDNIDEAYGIGHSILSSLQSACLLESRVDYTLIMLDPPFRGVRMHDVIRDLALWIARDCGKNQNKWMVHARANLIEAPQDGRLWREAHKISLMHNDIEELPSSISSPCPELTTLMLQWNNFSGTINYFPRLKYLDISHNLDIGRGFPEAICGLVELQYLNLSDNGIESLPEEMSRLQNLKYLHLRNTLASFPKGLLPKLAKLKVLDVYGSASDRSIIEDLDGFNKERCLVALGINVETATDFARLLHFSLPIRSLSMHALTGLTSISLSITERKELRFSCISESADDDMDQLVVVSNLHDGGLQHLKTLRFSRASSLKSVVWKGVAKQQQAFLPSLRNVILDGCPRLKDATWVIHLPKLEYLQLDTCENLEHVIDEEVLGLIEEGQRKAAFQCLSALALSYLPKLRSICDDSFAFPSLQSFYMVEIPDSVHVTPQIKAKLWKWDSTLFLQSPLRINYQSRRRGYG